MTDCLKWPLMVVLIILNVIFTVPVGAQSPLDTLQTHDVSQDGTAQATTVHAFSAAGTGSAAGAPVTGSVFETFMERINKLFTKLNSLASRVNELIDRLAKANEKKSVQAAASANSGNTKPVASASPAPAANVSGVAAKVAGVAASFPRKYATAQSFKYAPGTENGNLGCANVVSAVLREAGVPIKMILNCDGVKNALLGLSGANAWKRVNPPPYKPGDVVIWKAPSGGKHKHIGVVAMNGNSMMAMNNSSSKRHPVFSAIEYRPIEVVLRKA